MRKTSNFKSTVCFYNLILQDEVYNSSIGTGTR